MLPLTPADIHADPMVAAAPVTARSGLQATFRPITPADAPILGRYFLSLSERTKSLYGPHPFDQATADALCSSIDYAANLRLVATLPGTPEERVIAYFILQFSIPSNEIERYARAGISLDAALDCLVAPSVADDYQDHGLGTPCMRRVFQLARRLGRRNVVLMGGVYVENERAVHYYEKLGFQKLPQTFFHTGTPTRPSYDMYCPLASAGDLA